jgi:ribonuclease D
MNLITETAALEAFCARAARSNYVTVDTEFIRDRTYYSRLCLVQIADDQEAVAIDPLAPGIDLSAMCALMSEPVLKVFHAARQDIEIFFQMSARVPAPVFDTQVAAMVCGFGDAASYETLVARLAGASLDKSLRFTDWAKRPLSKRQLEYALGDVIHLRKIYDKLSKRLGETRRESWLAEEMAVLTDPATYRMEPEDAWRRLKTRSRRPRYLAVLRELAAWRETEAQRRDLPRNRILRDDVLADVAQAMPANEEELTRLRSVAHGQVAKSSYRDILAAVARGIAVPEHDAPAPLTEAFEEGRPGASVELLKVLLKIKCEESGVAQKLVASAADVEAIARNDNADVPALHGWRREVFGADALRLKHGRIALSAEGPSLKVVEVAS